MLEFPPDSPPVVGRATAIDGDTLDLSWATGNGEPFPVPVEVEIDGELQTVAMRDGRGRIRAPAHAQILIDPENKVLRQLDFIDAWKARPGS